MVAPRRTRKIFCTVIRLTENEDTSHGLGNRFPTERFSTRPSRLLPWADPYIAKLVRNLQDEVREEVRNGGRNNSSLRAELDPLPATDPEGGWTDDNRWNSWEDE